MFFFHSFECKYVVYVVCCVLIALLKQWIFLQIENQKVKLIDLINLSELRAIDGERGELIINRNQCLQLEVVGIDKAFSICGWFSIFFL